MSNQCQINNDQVLCQYCNNFDFLIWIHGHGQCSQCGTNIEECCKGEVCDLNNNDMLSYTSRD